MNVSESNSSSQICQISMFLVFLIIHDHMYELYKTSLIYIHLCCVEISLYALKNKTKIQSMGR